jgi:hypothetical protein
MEKEIICFGSLDAGLHCFPPEVSLGSDTLTAIAAAFEPSERRFVIAADGLCASDTIPMQIRSEEDQKIFFSQTRFASLVYAMAGLANAGNFELISAVHRQTEILSKRKFSNGYEYASQLCLSLIKVLQKAKDDGRIARVPLRQDLPPEEKGRLFTLYLLGFFEGNPFFRISRFYYDEMSGKFLSPRDQIPTLQDFPVFYIGSTNIQKGVMGEVPIDPRLAKYSLSETEKRDPRKTTINLVEACCDPVAVEVDPACRMIGGHIHAGELTRDEFTWIEGPKNPSRQS